MVLEKLKIFNNSPTKAEQISRFLYKSLKIQLP